MEAATEEARTEADIVADIDQTERRLRVLWNERNLVRGRVRLVMPAERSFILHLGENKRCYVTITEQEPLHNSTLHRGKAYRDLDFKRMSNITLSVREGGEINWLLLGNRTYGWSEMDGEYYCDREHCEAGHRLSFSPLL
jgi:hypothetical protein